MEMNERVARLEERVSGLAHDVSELHEVIHGPPYERSLRGRVHELETDRAAAKAAQAAVEAAKLVHAQASERRFTKKEKLIALAFTFAIAVCTIVTTVVVVSANTGHHP